MLAVWANHALTAEQDATLRRSLHALAAAEEPWPAWLQAVPGLPGSDGEMEGSGVPPPPPSGPDGTTAAKLRAALRHVAAAEGCAE